MTDVVSYAVEAQVATLTMDQPANRNAMTPALLDGLGDGLGRAAADDAVRVVVLTNSGPAFSSGADLKGADPRATSGEPHVDLRTVLALVQDSPKPVIARIAGHCMGGGVGLAAAADLSVAAEDVRFGFTEVRVGVAPAVISVVCLPKLRRSDALELFLTGARIEAARAASIGLITRAVPRGALDDAVGEMVDAVLAGGPAALAAAKSLVYRVPSDGRDDAFEWTASLSAELFSSEEAAAGMKAFRDKHPPPWAPGA